MQNHIRYLGVEDDRKWNEAICRAVAEYFEKHRRFHKARIRGCAAYDGRQAFKLLEDGQFDLVMLDMNLGESKVNGLDVLAMLAKENRAYFVIVVTGAVDDPTLEMVYGPETTALLRYGALNEAVRHLPAHRVRILHKPKGPADAAIEEMREQLESALDQYCSVSRERNIFRPLPGDPSLWEISYNGERPLTIPRAAPFELIRSALAQPNRDLQIIKLMQRIARSSGQGGAVLLPDETSDNLPDEAKQAEGGEQIDAHAEESGHQIAGQLPPDVDPKTTEIEVPIGMLHHASYTGKDLAEALRQVIDYYGLEPLLGMPARIAWYVSRPKRAAEIFARDDAAAELERLNIDLIPLLKARRASSAQKPKGKKATKAGRKLRISKGTDTKELKLARRHWKRFLKTVKKFRALRGFVDHIEESIGRGIGSKGRIVYSPGGGTELAPFWLTD